MQELTWADPAADLRRVLELPRDKQMQAAARTLRPQEMEVFLLLRGRQQNPLNLSPEERLHLLECWVRKILRVLQVEGFDL